MGNLSLYVETARKRSKRLRARFLTLGYGIALKELIAGLSEAERYQFEERAAIMEYDGGLSREKAERAALREVFNEEEHQ
jgi:hypothetical protein